jgi:hypothetical protein
VIHADNSRADAIAELQASSKFREWEPPHAKTSKPRDGILRSSLVKDKHWSVVEVAERGVSARTLSGISSRMRTVF